MTNQKKSKLEWQVEDEARAKAGRQADELIQRLKQSPPIDPLKVADSERAFLRTGGDDLGERYDGKLEYDPNHKLFLLFYNTKYDKRLTEGQHHPRTRFSISHELGHYFIEHHHDHLLNGGAPHESNGEFKSPSQWEREADAFASNLLLPTHLAESDLRDGELTFGKIEQVSKAFETSLVSTTIRGVQLSDLPCAVAGIRGGVIAWLFPSKPLISAGCYPGKKKLESAGANVRWAEFIKGNTNRHESDGLLRHWFQTFDREDDYFDTRLTQSFLPVTTMETLVVLLTMDEDDLYKHYDEDDNDYDDDDRDRFGRSRA